MSKHAAASAASIEVAPRADRLAVVVRDNGAGGADASHGGGLAGLADRTGASSARALVDLMRDGRQ